MVSCQSGDMPDDELNFQVYSIGGTMKSQSGHAMIYAFLKILERVGMP
jgi:hypothetical protein